MPKGQTSKRLLGITVLADFILNEGIEKVLRNVVDRADAIAVTSNPTVTAPAEEGAGSFQPPTDAGRSPRLFDRPLWGKRALWVRSGPSFHPNEAYYKDTSYSPRPANDLTDSRGYLVGDFIEAACERGLKVYLQLGASTPPGLREEDTPRLPDGRLPRGRMASIGSLASEAIRSYNRAYVRDLLENYPDIAGIRLDWPEYPCYTLDEMFQDFCPHVRIWAERHGFDFSRIQSKVNALYTYLRGSLTNFDLRNFASADRGMFSLLTLMIQHPEALEWLRLKSALSLDLLCDWRKALDEYGGRDKELSANAFAPPFSLFTGFDFSGAAEYCTAVSPKLYTMHWSLMVEFWGEAMLGGNPRLDETLVVKALAHLFDLGDDIRAERIFEYGYPKPDQPHPIPNEPQIRKIEQVVAASAHRVEVTPIVHGYGPLEDFCRRFEVAVNSPADGVWVNRYGYLSDEKLDAIGRIWKQK